MAESKRTFQGAKMNKDIEEKILKPGEYRDALNISVDFSEDGNIGSIENLKGNALIGGQNIISDKITNPKVIGSYPNPEENKIYYFVTGTNADGIFEYDATDPANPVVSTVIIDSTTAAKTVEQKNFLFTDAGAQASVAKNGFISVSSQRGIIESLTENFDVVSVDTPRNVLVRVKVPKGFLNTGDFVSDTISTTQLAISAPEVIQNEPTNITENEFTLNAEYTSNSASLTDIGFYWILNTGGGVTTSIYSNELRIDASDLVGSSALLGKYVQKHGINLDPFEGVAASGLILIDKSGATISDSTYTIFTNNESRAPHSITFSTLPSFPITVAEIASATTITDAYTPAQIQSGGNQISLSSNIVSPFTSTVTGQTAGSQIASVAYATNSAGTTLSEVKYFTLKASSINRWSGTEYVIVPAIEDVTAGNLTDEVDDRNLGYGSFFKTSGDCILNIAAPSTDGLRANATVITSLDDDTSGFSSSPTGLTFARAFGANNNTRTAAVFVSNFSANTSYQITIPTNSGIPAKTIRINKGTPSGTFHTSTLSLNLSGVNVTKVSSGGYQYNTSPNPSASYILGPVSSGESVQVVIPLNDTTSVLSSASSFVSSFDANNLSVTVTGKTEGVDFDYYIEDTSTAVLGFSPGIIFEGTPSLLGTTPTVNITYTT